MAHMVIFRSPDGKPGYHQAEGLEDAVRFTEMLRNQEQVTDARVFRMDEVPIEFKTYYRVEVASPAPEPGEVPPAGDGAEGRPRDSETAPEEASPHGEPAGTGVPPASRFGLFTRG